MTTHLSVEALRGIEILAENDIYDLAQFILRIQDAGDRVRSARCRVTTRMNLRSVAHALAGLARVRVESVLGILEAHAVPLDAMVVTPGEVARRSSSR